MAVRCGAVRHHVKPCAQPKRFGEALALLQQPLSTSTRLYLQLKECVEDVEEGMSALKTRSDTGDDKQSELRGQAKTADDAGHNARPEGAEGPVTPFRSFCGAAASSLS